MTGVSEITSESSELVRFLVRQHFVRTYIPYKTLSMSYSVYYIHTETFIILTAFFISNLSKMLKFAAKCEKKNKTMHQLVSKKRLLKELCLEIQPN